MPLPYPAPSKRRRPTLPTSDKALPVQQVSRRFENLRAAGCELPRNKRSDCGNRSNVLVYRRVPFAGDLEEVESVTPKFFWQWLIEWPSLLRASAVARVFLASGGIESRTHAGPRFICGGVLITLALLSPPQASAYAVLDHKVWQELRGDPLRGQGSSTVPSRQLRRRYPHKLDDTPKSDGARILRQTPVS